MSEFKEFQGKTLDAAIAEACAYYDSTREKLEIEIIEDAKSGIFGLVGARKARINARRVELASLTSPSRGKKQTRPENAGTAPDSAKPDTSRAERLYEAESDEPTEVNGKEIPAEIPAEPNGNVAPLALNVLPDQPDQPDQDDMEDDDDVSGNVVVVEERAPQKADKRPRGRNDRREGGRENGSTDDERSRQASQTRSSRRKQDSEMPEGKRRGNQETDAADSQDLSAMPRVNLTELDQDKLLAVTRQMILVLVTPILGEEEPTLEIKVSEDRMQVQIQSDSTGLLIGRDGQNLAAVQYLVARMISRAMEAQVRVQVDAGDYHSRQDVRLQELAVALADKVRATGKSQSTRPLSAYQRRVIHLALQEDPDVVTRSSGEGALKRVVVQRRKENSGNS